MKVFPSLAALLLLAACGGGYNTPAPSPDVSGAPGAANTATNCSGQPMVTVMNDWNQPVDLYAQRGDDATPLSLGSVLANTTTDFTLQPGVSRVYATASGQMETASTRLSIRRLVRFRYFCR